MDLFCHNCGGIQGVESVSLSSEAGGSRTHLWLLCRQPPCHLAPAPNMKCPRQESNLVCDLRRVACNPPHSEDRYSSQLQCLARESNPVLQFRGLPTTTSILLAVPAGTLARQNRQLQYPDLESNQDFELRRLACAPLHHQDQSGPTAGFAPAWTGLQDQRLAKSSHVGKKHEREDLNPVKLFWRQPSLPSSQLSSTTPPCGA